MNSRGGHNSAHNIIQGDRWRLFPVLQVDNTSPKEAEVRTDCLAKLEARFLAVCCWLESQAQML